MIATIFAVSGCILLASGTGSLHADSRGIALALAAGFSYAAYTVSIKGLLDKKSTDAVLAVVFCSAALLMSPLLFFFDIGWVFTVRGGAVALHLGLFATAGSYWLFVRGLKRVKIGTAATLSLGEPLAVFWNNPDFCRYSDACCRIGQHCSGKLILDFPSSARL